MDIAPAVVDGQADTLHRSPTGGTPVAVWLLARGSVHLASSIAASRLIAFSIGELQ
jgi:hypothetical protein